MADPDPPSAEKTPARSHELLPRFVQIGPITLDLFHRDGLIGESWIGFHPRELEVLWRLAETPDDIVTRDQLLKEVWRLDRDPETNRVEVNISRIRSKLHPFKLSWIVVTGDAGGYRLDERAEVTRRRSHEDSSAQADDGTPALDSYLRFGNEDKTSTTSGDEHGISGKRSRLD